MLGNIDIKLLIAITATIIVVIGYIPYFKDIFSRKTKPHLYTWLIWAITMGTATVALLYGGGKFGAIALIVGTILVFTVFGLSFKYGTKDITKKDAIALIVALLAIVVWWQLKNPLISILMISFIDGLGFIPTFRKTYKNPYSETISFWILMAIADVLIMISNAEYNFLTMFYLSILVAGNIIVVIIITSRRKVLKNPNNSVIL